MPAKKEKEELKLDIPMKGVMAKLQTARVLLQEKELSKSGKNDYANFTYFQLKDFLPEATKIFAKVGLYPQFNIRSRVIDHEDIIEFNNEGVMIRNYKKPIIKEIANLTIFDIENKDDFVVYEMDVAELSIGKNTKQNIYQAAGGRSTYYKRYLYRDALEIEENDEYDAMLGMPQTMNNVQPMAQMPQQPVYQQPVAQKPQQEVYQQPIMQEQPVYQQPVVNEVPEMGNSVTIENGNVVVDGAPDDLLSLENKQNIMNVITSKNLNGYEVINAYCQTIGVTDPSSLLNSHASGLMDYVNSL